MKNVSGWWFGTANKKLGYDDGREIIIGETHEVEGEIMPCEWGLHLSERIIDALGYAPGPVIYKVKGSGIIVPHGNPVDKFACSKRIYIAGGIDISGTLRKFACLCALDVVHLWDAPDVVIEYLKTGDEKIRAAARDAAWDTAKDALGGRGIADVIYDVCSAKCNEFISKFNSRLTWMVNKVI